MEKYEIRISISDPAYVDRLVAAIVRQGYAVYYNEDEKCVCFTGTDDEVVRLKVPNE